jgi:hypothetical protein
MAELENNAYQDNVSKKEVAPLTQFLEGVQSRVGLGNKPKRDRFDPYTRKRDMKEHSLGDALSNIEKMFLEAKEDEELDDIGDIDTEADEAPEDQGDLDFDLDGGDEEGDIGLDSEPEGDVESEPETDVGEPEIDNETDPEEGRIVGDDGETVGDIFVGPGQRYFMGASADPQMVIVSKVSEDYVWYNAFPFKKAEKLKKEIAADLFSTGSQTWLKDSKSQSDEELRSSIESVVNGRPGERVSLDDYQFSNIQVKYTGEKSGDLEPWKELESEYDVVVDSNLTNKQTYNLRMNNKELEGFRGSLQEKPVAERNFKIIRIVTEEREYMIESAMVANMKPDVRQLEEFEKDEVRSTSLKNAAAGYGAEGFVAGQRVILSKKILPKDLKGRKEELQWIVMDFVPFDEDDITLVLLSECGNYIASYIKPKDVTPVQKPDDDPEGKKVKETPKEKEVKFPESDLKTGETQEQKAITEEVDPNQAAGALVEFIQKDPALNKNRFAPAIENLQKHRSDGKYNSQEAVAAFRVLVDEGASKYFNDNEGKLLGDEFVSHQQMFPTEVKKMVAEKFRDQFEANVEMGNYDEDIEYKIAQLVEQAELFAEQDAEAVPFTAAEQRELKKFDNANVTAENVATYTWDKGTYDYTVKITKKPRTETDDMVYSAVTTEGDDEKIDDTRTKDSESFRTQEDLTILRDFLTSLNLNEMAELEKEEEEVDTTGLADEKGVTARDVHPEQLMMGIKVEKEHTKDKGLAKQIALDHLAEDPEYYTKLKKMESGDKKKLKEGAFDSVDGEFELETELRGKDVVITGEYSWYPPEKQTSTSPEVHADAEWDNLKVDGKPFDLDKLPPKEQERLEKEIWEHVMEAVEREGQDQRAMAFDDKMDARKYGEFGEESKPKKKKKDRTNPDGKEPAHSTTKMVNNLPVRGGKKIRTEVIGDVRIRYKTFEEKRKEDLKRKKTKSKTGEGK